MVGRGKYVHSPHQKRIIYYMTRHVRVFKFGFTLGWKIAMRLKKRIQYQSRHFPSFWVQDKESLRKIYYIGQNVKVLYWIIWKNVFNLEKDFLHYNEQSSSTYGGTNNKLRSSTIEIRPSKMSEKSCNIWWTLSDIKHIRKRK